MLKAKKAVGSLISRSRCPYVRAHTHRVLSRYTFLNIAEILVGPKKFLVYRDILCARSHFFKAALSEEWNAQRRPIELPDENPRDFDRYLKCVYNRKPDVDECGAEPDHLVNTYVLADKLGDSIAANAIADKITQWSRDTDGLPGLVSVNTAFMKLPVTSPMRRLMVDFYVHEGDVHVLHGVDANEWSSEFLLAVSQEFLRRSFEKNDDVYDGVHARHRKCSYHQHSESDPASFCGGGGRNG